MKEVIGDSTLYLGDCLDIMPTLGAVDALVTDPPYGIGESGGNAARRSKLAPADKYTDHAWDDSTADKQVELARSMTKHQIIFGGNYYHLPPTRCWLVWNKLNSGDFADCELAWTNLDKAVRKIDYMWNGMIRMEKHIERTHPTQKPVGVMNFCLDQLPEDAQIVLDPFMGSGTTGVACMERGKTFVGVERVPEYFDAACERIYQATRQQSLF